MTFQPEKVLSSRKKKGEGRRKKGQAVQKASRRAREHAACQSLHHKRKKARCSPPLLPHHLICTAICKADNTPYPIESSSSLPPLSSLLSPANTFARSPARTRLSHIGNTKCCRHRKSKRPTYTIGNTNCVRSTEDWREHFVTLTDRWPKPWMLRSAYKKVCSCVLKCRLK